MAEQQQDARNMHVNFAYIGPNSRLDDVEFYCSRKYTNEQLKQYLARLKQRALAARVTLVEVTVFSGDQEVWKGNL